MSAARSPSAQHPPPSPGAPSLAIASLTLGILGFLLSFIIVGGLLALVGLVLGAVHLRRQTGARRMGWTGVGLSAAGLVIALTLFSIVSSNIRMFNQGVRRGAGSKLEKWYGKPAPDLEVTTVEGDTVRLSELKGRRVILDFWATWHPGSVREVEHLIRLSKEAAPDTLTIVAISGEEPSVVRAFANEKGVNYFMACSARRILPEPYSSVEMLPTKFFIDREGNIQHVSVGYRDYAGLQSRLTSLDSPNSSAASTPR